MKQELKDNKKEVSELLSRSDAIKKIGGYAALTALGTFMILNPQKAQAVSIPNPGGEAECTDGLTSTCCPFCYDSNPNTPCYECDEFSAIDPTTDCTNPPGPCTEPAPFQGDSTKSNTTNKFNFDSKYKSKYKSKYIKK
jgi:hypothetical protein